MYAGAGNAAKVQNCLAAATFPVMRTCLHHSHRQLAAAQPAAQTAKLAAPAAQLGMHTPPALLMPLLR
jgi:hypothetical protein